ncbi:hypothetical protein [Methylobacterium sp. 77]|uniref:hypothetical protein n=1 Tax=Methylobacterium sp. 77 TaxID=1101192 RepID=UPI0003804D43|nr:hypothetical protein [Methylobacterium sp. 77]
MSRRFLGVTILLAALFSAGPGLAQNMALTPVVKPSSPGPAEPVKHPDPPPRPQLHAFGGELPNQRTGPMRPRVVRDICIGCDR